MITQRAVRTEKRGKFFLTTSISEGLREDVAFEPHGQDGGAGGESGLPLPLELR